MERLRVVTLNIWNRMGPWDARLPLLRKGLAELAPDLLGLQEVLSFAPDGGPAMDQAQEIAEASGYHVAYGPAQELGPGLHIGNALLSRHPIRSHQALPLPGGEETGEARTLLHAVVDTPHGELSVFVTHLSWKLHEGAVRLRQVRRAVEHVMAVAPIDESRLPPILMGDLNAEPESDEIRYLRGLAVVDGTSCFFADAWTWGGGDGPGYTFDRRNHFTHCVPERSRRIDYIFVRGPDRRFRGEPVAARVVFDREENGVFPTDHFGVLAEIST